jgi:hypothetical protein
VRRRPHRRPALLSTTMEHTDSSTLGRCCGQSTL